MSEQSIKKLKRKFIFIAMASFIVVMLLMGSFIFAFNVVISRAEIRRVLYYIAENDGIVPDITAHSSADGGDGFKNPIFHFNSSDRSSADDIRERLQALFTIGRGYDTPEFFYTTRYFAVLYDDENKVEDVIVSHIASVDTETAIDLAGAATRRFFRFGSFGDYYYLNTKRDAGGRIVVYLDSTSQILTNNRILYIAFMFLVMGSIITFVVMRLTVTRLIKPEIQNAELQKQFITNASHELKTPLSVIRANTELIEMTSGENEWTQATLRQVDRLQGLIENLVMITRAQERDSERERTDIDVSRAVRETAKTFETVALQEGKTLTLDIPDELSFKASEGDMRQLTSLLVDNAIKYCDAGGEVKVCLLRSGRRGRGIKLSVSNSFAEGKGVDYDRFFERFYRADESHNTEKGGYGIGLSIVEHIVDDYRGEIKVHWKEGDVEFLATLPGGV